MRISHYMAQGLFVGTSNARAADKIQKWNSPLEGRSLRDTEHSVYFDTLLADIYTYQNLGIMFICGDFNGRCGNLEDFINGIEHRNVVDFKTHLF